MDGVSKCCNEYNNPGFMSKGLSQKLTWVPISSIVAGMLWLEGDMILQVSSKLAILLRAILLLCCCTRPLGSLQENVIASETQQCDRST